MKWKFCSTIVLWFMMLNVLSGQSQLHFSQLTQSFTNCILKDSDGFIWVGTQDGLLRYGNYEFEMFRYSANEKHALPNNYVRDIIEDRDRNLWIGTFGGGLVKWDRAMERFYSYPINTNNESIHTLEIMQDSILLIGSENGLIQFNIYSRETTNLSKSAADNALFVNDLYVSHDDNIYLGTNEGLLLYSMENKKFEKLLKDEDLIVNCVEGLTHRIYIGTNKGLYIYNNRKDNFEHLLEERTISSILLIDHDHWYLGSSSGIAMYKKGDGYTWYNKDMGTQFGLQSDLIHVLYNINDDLIWAGTRKGVHQFSMRPPNFKSLQDLYSKTACSRTTLGMEEDKNNDIWICSREGLMHFTIENSLDQWDAYCHTTSNTPGMNDNYTINITRDSEDDLWLSYRTNGFSRLKEIGGKWEWENFPKANLELEGDGINQVFQDFDGDYWLASRGKGLIKFNPEDQSLQYFIEEDSLSNSYIFRIYQTEKNKLWLSTANRGLCRFDLKTNSFECDVINRKDPSSISANMVLATNTLSNMKLLICTTDGLNLLNDDGSYSKITATDGLLNNVIYAALEDDNGKIWVSTNEGISRIDLSLEDPKITNFNKTHGLTSLEFNQHSYLEHSSGIFLFGGVEGVTLFNPVDIESQIIDSKIAFTDFQLFNVSVPIGEENDDVFSLKKSINLISEIELDYDQTSISFEFAALGISNPENVNYQYKMEGLESDWINARKRNYAAYPKIGSGRYTFKVRLTDLNGNPITSEKSVQLRIATPPWFQWWAFTLYLLAFFGILYLISYAQRERTLAISKARDNEREVFRKKMARDFHDEAGNKITRISLMTDTLSRKSKDNEIVKTLDRLQDNIQELRSGMMDFIWVLDPGKDSLGATLSRFMDFANDTFEYSDIHFQMDSIDPGLSKVIMPSNIRRHFLLIMKEATTNILKHAEAELVRFSYSNINNKWTFNIIDDGKGFEVDTLKRINGMKNMKSRAKSINGSLKIESKKNVGSHISLTIEL